MDTAIDSRLMGFVRPFQCNRRRVASIARILRPRIGTLHIDVMTTTLGDRAHG